MSRPRQHTDLWIAALLGAVVVGGLFGPRLLAHSRNLLAEFRASSALRPDAEQRSAPPLPRPRVFSEGSEVFLHGHGCSRPLVVIQETCVPRHCW